MSSAAVVVGGFRVKISPENFKMWQLRKRQRQGDNISSLYIRTGELMNDRNKVIQRLYKQQYIYVHSLDRSFILKM